MSSANLDLVRSIYAAWERGDWRLAEWADPEIELVSPDGPNPGSWTGLAAIAAAWRDDGALSAFEDLRAEAEAYRELDAERVLVHHNWSGHGKTSALSLERMRAKSATLFHIRDGKVTRLVAYWDRELALADLGITE